jgi:futalosine hydrolase
VNERPVFNVAAAWDPELERFRALAGGALASFSVGIGLVDAAVGATRGILRHGPRHLVLLGTCGASPGSGLAVGDVVVGSSVRLVEPAVVEGRAAMPFGGDALALETAIAGRTVPGTRVATIANTLAVTADDALAGVLAAHGAVEHLEAYGVARACGLAGIGCTVVLGIANHVGARGRDEWRANHVAASARAAEAAWEALRLV